MTALTCTHCGSVVPPGRINTGAEHQFCCNGCESVYRIIHETGLDNYYAVARSSADAPMPASVSGKSFTEFDDDAFTNLYVRTAPDGSAMVELYLEGVHCSACVWLVERAPIAIPGVLSAELDVGRAVAAIRFNPESTKLSAVARFLDSIGYTPHPYRGVNLRDVRRREDRVLLTRIGVAGAIAANVMLIAIALYAGLFDEMEPLYATFFRWLSLFIVTPAVLYSGSVFFKGAFSSLRVGALHMDVPLAMAIAAGYFWGAWNVIRGVGEIYFDSVAVVIFLLLVGRWLTRAGQRKAADAIELINSLQPQTAWLVENGVVREVPVAALKPGALIEVRAGEAFPADGIIDDGASDIDAAVLTGESRPVTVERGARVNAGTTNLTARVRMLVEHAGETTRVGRLMREVEEYARRKAPIVQFADRVAGYFVVIVLVLAAVTLAVWWPRDPFTAVEPPTAMPIATSPCVFGLGTPLSISVGIGRAARRGILIKGGDVFERILKPGKIWLDKTGTITEGRVALARVTPLAGYDEPTIRSLVAALEASSSHPLARAVQDAARDAKLDLTKFAVTDVAQALGGGIRGIVRAPDATSHTVIVGSLRYVAAQLGATQLDATSQPGTTSPTNAATPSLLRTVSALVNVTAADGLTPVVVAIDGTFAAVYAFGDKVRPDARDAVAQLRANGWQVGILSGDAGPVVHAVARELGLDVTNCHGALSPEEKARTVSTDVAAGHTVVMVGDGVNDAAALAAASVGISVHGSAEAGLAAADVFLTRPGLVGILELYDGAHATMTTIKRNLAFSVTYNIIGAALTLMGIITPMWAAILMPFSSLTVVTSSLRSRAFRTAAPIADSAGHDIPAPRSTAPHIAAAQSV